MKAIILAAGKGTRMRGLCRSLPKPMLPIANRPIIATTISRLGELGVDHVAVVVGHEGERLTELLGPTAPNGARITYVWQEEKLGTGHAVSLCEEFVASDPFALMWGDVMTHASNYTRIAERYARGDCDAVLTVFRVPDACRTAAVDVTDGLVTGITERPEPGTRLNAFANAGIFVWPARMFEMVRRLKKSPRGEYEFTDGIAGFVASGGRVAALELNGYRENITDPEACVRVNELLLNELVRPDTSRLALSVDIGDRVSFRGSDVHANAHIGRDCALGPHVSVGNDVQIGDGCRIGPNVSIGAGSVIGPGSMIGNSVLLPDTRVGRDAVLDYAMTDAGAILPDATSVIGSADGVRELLAG
jgi:NDP-sugar pyrophosphorylase family protein